ncbi:hypothetical protein [Marinobacter piscensis]|uniref:hypothetical protein n=1 Tax=Marinobacter piscensis TaxID=1562308 RepID=UPI001FEBD648|nr:hypothetical protein [Marinobacter piscensis]
MDSNFYLIRRSFIARFCASVAGLVLFAGVATADSDTAGTSEAWLQQSTLSEQQLNEASGRQGLPLQIQMNNSNQGANVSDNVLSGQVVTGNNLIDGGAFQNMSGVATVIQNSGNQVVIQDTTQINVLINR